ncbi:MAG: hypothetical protein HY909_28415 [Deltaproteobacteria bacterium]|nr:hypothetical protein [Deltaproteobacteria bacterium]
MCARRDYGEHPLPAAAALARRGDRGAMSMLAGALAFAEPEDMDAVDAGAHAGALAAVALAEWLPRELRATAATGLGAAGGAPEALAALQELAGRGREVPWSQAQAALGEALARSSEETRAQADRLRVLGRQVRERTRGELGRQERQRMVARGEAHPVVAFLAGDVDFLVGVVPPLADSVREVLVPYLIAAGRHPTETLRTRAWALFHRRSREAAGPSVGAVARTPAKAKDAAAVLLAVKALGTLGAVAELVSVCGAVGGAARAAALAELDRCGPRAREEVPEELWRAAMERAGRPGR